MTVEVAEPHFGAARRRYLAFPAATVLDNLLGAGWSKSGSVVRFKALDGYVSVFPASALSGPDAFLAFAMADGSTFEVDNLQQNERNVPLDPWYLVWVNIRNSALLRMAP